MRHFSPVFGLTAVLLACGCADSKWSLFRHSPDNVRLPADKLPLASQLVASQNNNAQKIQSLWCPTLELDCKQGFQEFHISGKLACQKPRNFRMRADVLGHTEADIGSNDQEFWYWVKRGDPYLVHCSYQDLERGGVRIPFPFQPDWVMEALGMSEYDLNPTPPYVVQASGRTIQLVQSTRNLQGQSVRKLTEFDPSTFKVTAHILQSEAGKEICRAQVTAFQDSAGVVIPRKISFSYPAERFEMKMTLGNRPGDVSLHQQFDPQQDLFRRPALNGVQNYDLARGAEGINQIAPVGGLQR
jgi:hypothetical protein